MKILIADDHDLIRDAIITFLGTEGLTDVTGVGSLPAAVDLLKKGETLDIALLDYNMPGMNGMDGLKQTIALMNGKPVTMLSGTASPAIARRAFEAGARGFFPKTLSANSLAFAIQVVCAGQIFAPYEFMNQDEAPATGNLTHREAEVLRCLYEGLANKEIAQQLDLQEVTVKLHVKTLCRKLGAKNRTQAAMIGKDHMQH